LIIAALNTGMRKTELLNLKWNQVDLRGRLINVIKTKSGKNREVPINDDLLAVLQALGKKDGRDYVFLGPGGKPMKSIRKSFAGACRKAGIKELRFHDLRHTFGTRLIQNGTDIVTVQHLLGHHSVTVTQRYTHTNLSEKRQAVERLAAKKPENLARIWHTEKGKTNERAVSPPFSVN